MFKQARIYRFLLKTKKQNVNNKRDQIDNDDPVAKEERRLRKKVEDLMKKQKLPLLRSIIKDQDKSKPWGQDAQAKVLSLSCLLFFSCVVDSLVSWIFLEVISPFCRLGAA